MYKTITEFLSKIYNREKLKSFSRNGIFQKTILIIGAWIIALIPTYVAIFHWNFLDSVDFLQRFLVIITSLFILGSFQISLIVIATIFTIFIFDLDTVV